MSQFIPKYKQVLFNAEALSTEVPPAAFTQTPSPTRALLWVTVQFWELHQLIILKRVVMAGLLPHPRCVDHQGLLCNGQFEGIKKWREPECLLLLLSLSFFFLINSMVLSLAEWEKKWNNGLKYGICTPVQIKSNFICTVPIHNKVVSWNNIWIISLSCL